MKKICMIVFGMMFACGAYATNDIAANAESGSCTEPTLGTYEGSADFEAKWDANDVKIRWYNNNTLMQNDTVVHNNIDANTCEYDSALNLPTNPQRTGYTFAGWKVRPAMNFSTLTSLETGSERWGKGYVLSSGADYCYHKTGTGSADTVNCKTDSNFNTLNQKEWKVEFRSGSTKGMLYGSGHCSAKSGDNSSYTFPAGSSSNWLATYNQLEAASGTKQYCWCQATGWQPENSSTIYANSNQIMYGDMSVGSNAAWVFGIDVSSAATCARNCATACAGYALDYSVFRRALFVGAGN